MLQIVGLMCHLVILLVLFYPRQSIFVIYLLTLISMLVFTFTLNLGHVWVVFITAGILG